MEMDIYFSEIFNLLTGKMLIIQEYTNCINGDFTNYDDLMAGAEVNLNTVENISKLQLILQQLININDICRTRAGCSFRLLKLT